MESSNVLQTNNWHNVIMTYDANGVNIFLDGVSIASNSDQIDATPIALLQNITVGSNVNASFDEIKLFDKVLVQDEITHLAYDGNYSKNLGNSLHDLKFNELNHNPTTLTDERTSAAFNVNKGSYENGFVAGSKSIRLQSGGFVSLNETNVDTHNGLSISTWVNLDNLTDTNQHILKKDGVIDFSINNNSLSLTLGPTIITFTDIIPTPPMLNDEKFHFSDPSTTFDGSRLESYIHSKYSNKLTLSTWVKNDPSNTSKHNIISIGDKLHIGLNTNKELECQVDVISSTTTVSMDVSAYTIDNVNYSGDIFNSIGIGTDSIAFDVTSPNALLKYKLKRVSFGIAFRNYAPSSLSIIGVDGTTETTLVTYPIIFRNSTHVYDIVIEDTNAAIDNDKIKVIFNGSGTIKVNNVKIETLSEDSITVSVSTEAKTVTISGNVSRPGILNIYREIERTPSNLIASTTTDSTSPPGFVAPPSNNFAITFEDTRDAGTYEYYLSIEDGTKQINFEGLNLSVQIEDPTAPEVKYNFYRMRNVFTAKWNLIDAVSNSQVSSGIQSEFIIEFFHSGIVTTNAGIGGYSPPWGQNWALGNPPNYNKLDATGKTLLEFREGLSGVLYSSVISPTQLTQSVSDVSGYHYGWITNVFNMVIVIHPSTKTYAVSYLGGGTYDHNTGNTNQNYNVSLNFGLGLGTNDLLALPPPIWIKIAQSGTQHTLHAELYDGANLSDYEVSVYWRKVSHAQGGACGWRFEGFDTAWGSTPPWWLSNTGANRSGLMVQDSTSTSYPRASEAILPGDHRDFSAVDVSALTVINPVTFNLGQATGYYYGQYSYNFMFVIVKHKSTGREASYWYVASTQNVYGTNNCGYQGVTQVTQAGSFNRLNFYYDNSL